MSAFGHRPPPLSLSLVPSTPTHFAEEDERGSLVGLVTERWIVPLFSDLLLLDWTVEIVVVQVVLVLLTPLSLLWSLLRSLPSFSVTHSGPLRNVGGGVPKSPSFSFSIDPHIAKKVHKTGRIAFEI